MAFTTIALTGTFLQADNSTAATGNVTFIASTTMQDSSNNQIIAPTLSTGTLNGSGSISVNLTATDDSTTQPSGVTYEVTENIDGAGQNKYSIEVPSASTGATLDLADITPAVTPIISYSYATQAYVDSASTSATGISFTAGSGLTSTTVQAAIEEVRNKSKYTHDQSSPTTTWSITHNLGYKPNVAVVDTSDTLCFGDVDYTNDNALVVTFAQSFGGKAYLS
jgi:hypothetical protein